MGRGITKRKHQIARKEMIMNSIKIAKDSIPYITDVNIAGENFQFEYTYNSYDKRVYVTLYDADGNLLYPNEPILFGIPLWFNQLVDEKGNFNHKYPKAFLIPNTEDRTIVKITYENIDKIEILVEE